ncbi:MAG: asparagine synthase (glutamine-hydrolyzing) [Minisyncoccia bacterium]
MCGVTGILRPSSKDSIRQATEFIRHRGPDDEGFFEDDAIALGMRRLSIIDIKGGKQPIVSENGRYLIFFNGEIYNYKELRQEFLGSFKLSTESDTEVLLRLFELKGLEAFGLLRGMFALVIYDKEKKELVLARDPFGIKPLYYLKENENIKAFASEIKSFLALEKFSPEINEAAVFNYLSFQYNPLPETFFKKVFKLSPGHFMTIKAETGEYTLKSYWKFRFKAEARQSEERARQEVLERLEDSVSHHMIADVPVGAFLSGGIDSSIIATLMQKERGVGKIKTFNVGFGATTEAREAWETARVLGTEHHEVNIESEEYFKNLSKVVWHFDEPVADPSAVGLYFLAREASKHVKVVLSGEGADELFGGYNIYLEPFARQKIAWLPKKIIKIILGLPFEFRGKNYLKRASERLEDWYIGNASIFKKDEVKRLWRGRGAETFSLGSLYKEAGPLSEPTKMQYIDINTWLVGDILAKADKMSMAHSLELRVPFLDKEIAELAAALPDRLKWRHGETKFILREACRGLLPETTRRRKKLGFPTPVGHWFAGNQEWARETILGNALIKAKFDTEYIKEIFAEHAKGRRDNGRKIYLLLILAIWYNVFILKQKP